MWFDWDIHASRSNGGPTAMSKKPEAAYKNMGFLNSASARTLRILSE